MENITKFKETEVGLVPEEWNVVPVEDFCSLITSGGTPSRRKPDYYEGGVIPWIKTQELRDSYIFDTQEKITELALKESSARLLPAHTVSLAMYGATVGMLGIFGIEATTNQACCNMVVNNDNDFRYLYYALLSRRQNLIGLATGGAQQNISVGLIKEFKVPRPDLEEQQRIASILSSLDDKIELNRQINANLEKMASALFKRWFVDFEFPDESGRPYKNSGGKMMVSELGEIPEGWKVVPFADAVEIISGGTPKTSETSYWGGDIPWFSVVDAPNEVDIFVVDTEKKITNAGVENSAAQILEEGTTIITARGTVGKIALVGVPMAMNQSCYGLRGKFDRRGFYTYFCTKALVTSLQNSAHGSVFDTITRETFTSVSLVMPTVGIITAFEEKVSSMLDSIKNNLFETRSLSQLRDMLLPRLMSGRIRTV